MSKQWKPPFLNLNPIDCVSTGRVNGRKRYRVNFLANWYSALTWDAIVGALRKKGVADEDIDLVWDFSIFPKTTLHVGSVPVDIRKLNCPFRNRHAPVEYDIIPLVEWFNQPQMHPLELFKQRMEVFAVVLE